MPKSSDVLVPSSASVVADDGLALVTFPKETPSLVVNANDCPKGNRAGHIAFSVGLSIDLGVYGKSGESGATHCAC